VPSYRRLLPTLAFALLATIGCADGGGAMFDNEGGQLISCMRHQPEPPGSRYTDMEHRNTAELLAVLRYYTAHGTKPYCDAAPATATDQAWAELYVQPVASREGSRGGYSKNPPCLLGC
jgi:hypothetical protein